MPTIGYEYLTLADWAKRADPERKGVAKIVEALEKKHPIIQDLPVIEGNLDTGHQMTSRLALPSPTYRGINQGVGYSASATEQFTETAALLESRSAVDVEHPGIKRAGMAFRFSEDKAHAMGFMNEMGTGLWYNSTKNDPLKFHGLTPRLDVVAGNPAATQIVKAYSGASGNDQTSIWLLGLSPETVFGFFPAGSKGGFDQEDLGRIMVDDKDGKQFLAWVTRFIWRFGLGVQDYRYVVRVCNVDTSAAAANGTDINITLAMEDAITALFSQDGVEARFYMNRWAFAMFNKQLMAKDSNLLQWLDLGGKRIPHFHGIPIRITDGLVNTETLVA